jgi:hypothetical protein
MDSFFKKKKKKINNLLCRAQSQSAGANARILYKEIREKKLRVHCTKTTGTARLTQETLRKLWTAVRDCIHNIKTCTHLWTAVRD